MPCEDCPLAVLGETPLDRRSRLTWRLLELLGGGLAIEQPPPWDWLCQAAGIPDIETFAECWLRLGIYRRTLEERQQRSKQDAD